MKKLLILVFTLASLVSCKKCYDCTKKCGTCTNSLGTVAGCEGDEALNGFSVDSWKLFLETQGYTCSYNNITEEACGKEARDNKEDANFECLSN